MSPSRLLVWLALLVAASAPARARLPGLPFMLDDPDGHWRLGPLARTLPDGSELVATISPRIGTPRLFIFKAPATPRIPDALAVFGHRLRGIILVEPTANVRSVAATKIGYAGRLVSVDVPRPDGTSACEIFTFAVGDDYWGLVQITPAGAGGETPLASLKKAAPAPAGAVALAPYHVHEDPVTSFPLGLRVTRQSARDRVGQIFVTDVPEGSLSEQLVLKIGDEILSLEGRPVTAYAGGISGRSELGRILIDRRPGSTLELDIRTPGEAETRSVTLIAGRSRTALRPW